MNTVTKKEIKDAKICIMEIIKDCKYNPSFLDTYHFEYDKNNIETVFKSKNLQIDFCRRDNYFTVITDQLTFTLLKNEYGVLWEKELIRREKRRNSLLNNKNSVTDKEYNDTLDCICKLVRNYASIPVASVIKYGFEDVDSLKADGEFMELVTEFQSDNIEICGDHYNQHIHAFTDPETFSKLKRYHDEYLENFLS